MAASRQDYLVISRGKWDESLSSDDIQRTIERFYAWRDRLVGEGRMKRGQRLAAEGRLVTRNGVLDGPFAETKEVIGGYWIFVAESLEAAAALAAENPCLACGLQFEVRPIDPAPASAYAVTPETPASPAVRR